MTQTTIKIQTADTLPFEGAALFVVGQYKCGKTVLGATASAYAPNPLNPNIKTELPDVMFVQLEPNGIRSAVSLGLVPKHVLDLSGPDYRVAVDFAAVPGKEKTSNEMLLDWGKVRLALLAAAQYVKATPEIKVVVVDNLSRYCEMLEAAFQLTCKKDGKVDSFEVYAQIKKANIWLANLFVSQKVLLIALAHVKSGAGQDAEKLSAKAVGGDATSLVPAIPAGSAGFWSGYADAVLCAQRKKVKAGTDFKYEYKTLLTSSNKLPSGNRFGLEGEMPSHLGSIIKKFYPNL